MSFLDDEFNVLVLASCILFGILMICELRDSIEEQHTKQIEIQLKIEMIKSGITNFPSAK